MPASKLDTARRKSLGFTLRSRRDLDAEAALSDCQSRPKLPSLDSDYRSTQVCWLRRELLSRAVCSRPVKKLDDLAAANADLELIMFGQVAFISVLATEFGNCHLRPAI